MIRLIMLALVFVASASFNTTLADKKKKKAKAKTETVAQLPVTTASDSLSYAAGMAHTQGLIPYLKSQFDVDTAYMSDFIDGLREASQHENDARFKARNAGYQISQMIDQRMLSNLQKDLSGSRDSLNRTIFYQGFINALQGDTSIYTLDNAKEHFETRLAETKELTMKAYRTENEQWLKENATKEGVKTTASGLQYRVLTMGNGAKPSADDEVTVKYEGKTIDGNVFDSSYKRNPQTSEFRCNQVIKGWTEALTMMPVGSKWELFIPQNLAYGARQAGQIKPFSTLIFTVELISIKQKENKK